jgi:hypothetical protein
LFACFATCFGFFGCFAWCDVVALVATVVVGALVLTDVVTGGHGPSVSRWFARCACTAGAATVIVCCGLLVE